MTQASDLIDKARGALEDWGSTVTDNIVLTAADPSGTVYQLSSPPIKTFSETLTDNAALKARGTDYTLNYNNAELTVKYAQTSGHTLALQYTKVLYRDERILTALAEGVRRMYPYVYKTGECYVAGTVSQFAYNLASTTDVPVESSWGSGIVPSDYVAAVARADLAKVQSRIHKAEFLNASTAGSQSWRPFMNFGRTTQADLSTDSAMIAGDALKLIYSAPCTPPLTLEDNIDIPDAFIDAPVWYALGVLLDRKESVRSRADSYQASAGANSNPPGNQQRTSADYFRMFWEIRANPMRPMATEIRRRLSAYARSLP